MDLLSLMLVIIVVGVFLWAANTYLPMQPQVKSLLNIVVIIVLVLWCLSAFGLLAGLRRPIVVR